MRSFQIGRFRSETLDALADLFQIFAQASPTQLHQSRAMKASDARPITICSIWYRIWAPTLCNDASSVWSTSTGTCAHALRSWMKSKDFADVRPSVLFHSCTNVYADVSCQPSPVTVGSLIGLAAHNRVKGGGPGCSRHGLSLVVTSSSISSSFLTGVLSPYLFRGYSHLAAVSCPCCYSCLRCYFQHCVLSCCPFL
jgi:hypothetical protein